MHRYVSMGSIHSRSEATEILRHQYGEGVLDLRAGNVCEPPNPVVKDAIVQALNDRRQDMFQLFQPTGGVSKVKQAIARFLNFRMGFNFEGGQVAMTNGAKDALISTFFAFKNMLGGLIVGLVSQTWPTYRGQLSIAGGEDLCLSVESPNELVTGLILTRMADTGKIPNLLVLNLVENPAGSEYSVSDLTDIFKTLATDLRFKDTFVLLDTAYRFYHSEFDTLREGTIVRDSGFDPRKVVVIFGLGKEGLVGHSVRSGGVATMDAGLLDGILHYQSQTTTHPCIFSQIGTIAALKDPERENKVRQLRQNTVEKVKLFNAIINSCNGINQLAKRGPYAVLEARRSHQLAKSETDRPIVEVFAELGLLGVCGTQFGFDKTVVRLNLGAIPLEEIEPIAKRIHDRFHTAV